MWEVPARSFAPAPDARPAADFARGAPRSAPPPHAAQQGGAGVGRGQRNPKGAQKGSGTGLATHLRNGKEPCKNFNRGSCPEPCPKNPERACSMIVSKSGRVCGMRNHCAVVCRKAPIPEQGALSQY